MKDLKVFKQGASIFFSGVLAFTLVGCSNTKQSAEITSSSVAIEQTNTKEESIIEKNIENADSAVEAAIGIMLDGAEKLKESSDDAKETESYQKAKETTLKNFDDLFNFLLGKKEIEGYTINDVKDSTVETATNALITLDNYIEKYIPDYKDKAKEKISELKEYLTSDEMTERLAKLYNKFENAKDEFIDYKDKIKEEAEKLR